MLIGTRRALLGARDACKYLLRATFDAANQGYTDAQVLDTAAEGVQKGQLTVVEVDGTLAIVSNKCAFTAQTTVAWGDLGFYSPQAITRALGRALLSTVNVDANNTFGPLLHWLDDADLDPEDWIYFISMQNSGWTHCQTYDGAAGELENNEIFQHSASTDYQFAIVLGGYDSNGMPWRSGQASASFLYGAAFFIKGGTFTNWTLVWRSAQMNTATLYVGFQNSNSVGTIDNFRVPDRSYQAVLQPTCLSTFTGSNGTSLDAITPEVGGSWTEQSGDWDIQGNRASLATAANSVATVASGISDILADCVAVSVDIGGYAGIALRFSDTSNYWYVRVHRSENNFAIIEVNGGGFTIRATTPITYAGNHDVRCIAYGQTIDAFMDGGNKLTYGAAALNEGATIHGLYGRTNVATVTLDKFAVYPRTAAVYDSTLNAC